MSIQLQAPTGQRKRRIVFDRSRAIVRLRLRLERSGYPRLQMMLIVAITGGAGFLASFLLLHAGMEAMWLRYACAVMSGYVVFLGLLWIWLRTQVDDYVDLPDPGILSELPSVPDLAGIPFSGAGGAGGGGGASASFDGIDFGGAAASSDLASVGDAASAASDVASDAGDALSAAGDAVSAASDADEFAIPLVVIVLIAILLASSIWVIYTAPALFAELLFDGALSTTLYRRLRRTESQNWLQTALGRTVWPFVGIALLAGITGAILGWQAPGAHTLGEVIAYERAKP